MVPETSPSSTAEPSPTDDRSSTLVNGLLGGIAGVVLSFVPLSPLLGGTVAGYLEGGRGEDGLKVGAIAGLLMLVPFVFLFFVLFFFLGFAGMPAMFGLVGFFFLFFAALYTIGLSVLGGYLGVYLKNER